MGSTPEIQAGNLRTIVAATDLSDTAAAALQWAKEIAIDHRAALHIVHASNLTGWSTDYLEIDARVPAQIQDSTRRKLEEIARQHQQSGLDVVSTVRPGEPCDVILAAADTQRADLIVVGTRGARGLDYLLLGSTAQRVVQRASSPVLTVHPQDAEKERPIRRILVATDFSPEAEAALRTSLTLSKGSPAETQVILMHAYLVPYDLMAADGFVSATAGLEQWQTAQSDVEHRLESSAQPLREAGIAVEILGLEGYPPEVVIDKAHEKAVDLIAMGTHGRRGLTHALLGSTAERVIHRAPCPVLTVRRHRSQQEGESHAG
jgi:nucleotide-binding universal stress UspA family protein